MHKVELVEDWGLAQQKLPLKPIDPLESPMFLHVLEARHIHDYTIWLRFNDGTCGEVDLSGELEGPVFGPLRDVERFKHFTVTHHTLAWENGADLAPEFLREHVRVAV